MDFMDISKMRITTRQFCTFGVRKEYREIDDNCIQGDDEHNVFYYGAPLVFLVCWDKNVCWSHPESGESSGMVDSSIVTTHMMLEAASIGLGTVWISYFDKERAAELLDIPDDYEILCMLYAGYPAEDFRPNKKLSGQRFPIEHTCFDNSFGEPYVSGYKDDFKDPRLE